MSQDAGSLQLGERLDIEADSLTTHGVIVGSELEALIDEDLWNKWRAAAGEIDSFEVALERNDVTLDEILLFWAPMEAIP